MTLQDSAPERRYHREVPIEFVPERTLHKEPSEQTFEDAVADQDEVKYGFSKIPPEQKKVLELLFLEAVPPTEIVQILDKNPTEITRTAILGLQSMRFILGRTRDNPFELLERKPDTTLDPLPSPTIRTTSIKGWLYSPHLDQHRNPKPKI